LTIHSKDASNDNFVAQQPRQRRITSEPTHTGAKWFADMSFGWSAGNIAAAITLVYNLVEALDSHGGAAGDYRDTVAFLRDLKRTLEPLRTFTAWQTYPEYGREIGEQVEYIKEPIGKFLDKVLKYAPSLGAKAAEGHYRHILRKSQWYLFMSKKILNLRKKIESNMRIIDSLMQRLTL
jgi:hypothetical protein